MGRGGTEMGCCGITAKYLILLLNAIVLLGGFILMIMGIVLLAKDDFSRLDDFEGDGYHGAGVIILLFSLVIMGFSFLGCFGAMRENRCLLLTYGWVVFVVFVFIFAAAIAAFIFAGDADELVRSAMKREMTAFMDGNEKAEKIWNALQKEGECCGINNATDWTQANATAVIPDSCCKKTGCDPSVPDTIWKEGCLAKYIPDLEKITRGLGWVGLLFSFFLVGVIFLSCRVGRSFY